jgi:hypothetical protein
LFARHCRNKRSGKCSDYLPGTVERLFATDYLPGTVERLFARHCRNKKSGKCSDYLPGTVETSGAETVQVVCQEQNLI